MMRLAFLLLLTLLAVPHAGLAQTDPLALAGRRVRLSAAELGPRKQVGTMVEVYTDTLLFKPDGQSTPSIVRAGSLTGLEVSHGRRSHVLAGMGIGLLVGAASGAAIAKASDATYNEESGLVVIFGTLVGSGLGILAGAVVGSMVHTERWYSLPLPINVGFQPNAHAIGLAVTFE